MSLATFLHRRVVLPAFESGLKRRRTLRYWAELERSQWLSPEELERHQLAALGRLLSHAAATCPYYRERWQGLDAGQIRTLGDFAAWPLLTREDIAEHRARMRTERPGVALISKATGGSSGVPLRFDLDTASHERRTAAWHRGYEWAGAGPGTRQLHLWGTPSEGLRLKDRLYHSLHRRTMVSCFRMGEGFHAEFARTIEQVRPEALVSYVNPLYETAAALERARLSPRWRPRSIVVGAEKLHGFQRELIERVFGAPVYETYGSREFMLIGAECGRREGLHLTAEHLLVEIVGDDGVPTPHGQVGNVVITDLFNYGMPFVRYATGDRAVAGFGRCACGRGLPLLRGVVGRRLDVLRMPDGRVLPGEFFPHLVKDFSAVKRFQVIQEAPGHVRFLSVAPGIGPSEAARLKAAVLSAVGPSARVTFEAVAEIPLTAAGKLRVVVNLVEGREAA